MTDASTTAAGAAGQAARQDVLAAVRTYVQGCRPGARVVNKPTGLLGAGTLLADRVGLPAGDVQTALAMLAAHGSLRVTPRGYVIVAREAGRPQVNALRDAVRERIRTGHYRTGEALPTGLLGLDFALQPHHVRTTCTALAKEHLLRDDPDGPHGPGYYVAGTASPSPPTARSSTPHEMELCRAC
ncbi:hypothetical protein [Streptomyces sp. NBC_00239]|uniref:hypothetical protein n=1 Tax=Streptomyces sp. NBC_00239 TaxID=2903640 RepID=UPI002E296D1F|nr:hypothetical protein [Streptomyces sp. NBC_00239]